MRAPIVACTVVVVATLFRAAPALPGGEAALSLTKVNLDLPYRVHEPSEEGERAPDVVIFYGSVFEGDGFFYALDRSGSTLDNGELEREKEELVRNIREFSDDVFFAVCFYDAGLIRWPPSPHPVRATAATREAAIAWVLGTPGGGGTCVAKGILASVDFANLSPARRNVVIWLGDGCTTCPGFDPAQYAQRALAEITARNVRRHEIHAIIVGPEIGICAGFPRALSAMNQGTYTRITR
jgi:hypothetical protein